MQNLNLILSLKKSSFFLILLISFQVFPQNFNSSSKDSLLQVVATTTGREKLNNILRFCQDNKRSSPEETLKYCADGIALAEELKDVKAKAELLRFKGVSGFTIGDMENSLLCLNNAIAINNSIRDSLQLGKCYHSLGNYYSVLGDFKASRIQDSLSLAIGENIGDLEMIFQAKRNIGTGYLLQGMYPKSLELFEEALSFCKTHQLDCTGVLINRAIAINNIGKPSEALEYFFEGRKAFIEKEDFSAAALVEHHIGYLLQRTELYEEALDYFDSVKMSYEKSGNVNRLSAIYLNIGQVMYELGRLDEAECYLNKALDFKKGKGIHTIGDVLVDLGLVALKRENYKLAFTYFQEAKQVYEVAEDDSSLGMVYNCFSMYYLGIQDYEKAEKYALKSLALNKQFGLKVELVQAYETLVKAYEGQIKFDLALQTKKELETTNIELKGSKELLAITKKLVTETLKKNVESTRIENKMPKEQSMSNSSNTFWLLLISTLLVLGGVFYYVKILKSHIVKDTVKIEHLQKEEADVLLNTLQQVMEYEKPYLKQEITLNSLAELVGTTDKKLSALLNHILDISFYDFVNKYRVEALKEKLQCKEYEKYTLLGIAYSCGFNSKSSFYRVFKKETGISPATYKNRKAS